MKKQQDDKPTYDFSGVKLWQKGVEWDGYDVRLGRDEQAPLEQDPFEGVYAAGSSPMRGGLTKKKKIPYKHTPVPDAVWYADPPVTGTRFAVLAYVCRHQAAFGNKFTYFTIDEFAHGRWGRGKRMDRGCGVTNRTAICDALKWLLDEGTEEKPQVPWLCRVNLGSAAHTKYAYWINLRKIHEIEQSFQQAGVRKADSEPSTDVGLDHGYASRTPRSADVVLDSGRSVRKADSGRVRTADSHIKETSGEGDIPGEGDTQKEAAQRRHPQPSASHSENGKECGRSGNGSIDPGCGLAVPAVGNTGQPLTESEDRLGGSDVGTASDADGARSALPPPDPAPPTPASGRGPEHVEDGSRSGSAPADALAVSSPDAPPVPSSPVPPVPRSDVVAAKSGGNDEPPAETLAPEMTKEELDRFIAKLQDEGLLPRRTPLEVNAA